jgi:hypothetical protein
MAGRKVEKFGGKKSVVRNGGKKSGAKWREEEKCGANWMLDGTQKVS